MHSPGLQFGVTRNDHSPIALTMNEYHVAPALPIEIEPGPLQGLCHNLPGQPRQMRHTVTSRSSIDGVVSFRSARLSV